MPLDPELWATTSVKIRRDLLARLEEEAEQRILGRAFLINCALEQFLDQLPPLPAQSPRPARSETAVVLDTLEALLVKAEEHFGAPMVNDVSPQVLAMLDQRKQERIGDL